MKKEIVSIVLNNFLNDSRVLKEALSLKKLGYNVTVIALYDDGVVGLKENEQFLGIQIHRVRLHVQGASRRLRMLVRILQVIELSVQLVLRGIKADIVHCNDLVPLPIGVVIKILSFGRVKLVYDAHELEMEKNGHSWCEKKIESFIERICLRFVDQMITVCDSIAEEYVNRYKIKKPCVIMNAPLYRKFEKNDIFRQTFPISAKQKILLYQGMITEENGIRILVESFKQIKRKDIVLVIMGYGPLSSWAKKEAMLLDNVFFHEAVSPKVLLEYTCSADYGACIFKNSCLSYYYALPNKFFEYAMAGLPIIMSAFPEMMKMNTNYGIGEVIENLTSADFLKGMDLLLNKDYYELQSHVIRLSLENSWEVQEQKLKAAYFVL